MIDFTRAFDSAWERMMVILFRPFDLGKWFVIGFSAFLAGLLQGGNGFTSYYNNTSHNYNFQRHTFWQANPHGASHNVVHTAINLADHLWSKTEAISLPFGQTVSKVTLPQINLNVLSGLPVMFFVLGAIFVLALVLVIYWLGARGQFMLIDNVVRNRGAIAWPWSAYTRQANSLFFFYLFFLLITLVVLVPIAVVAIVMAIPLYRHSTWPEGWELALFVILGLIYMAVAVILTVILFIFREWGVPLMFRNGLMARPAFMKSMRLIADHPGSVALFVLLRIAIFIGMVVISLLACCFTCCLEAVPYLGTVILLPAIIFVRCFSLDCLAQFGPEYDVWTVDVPPGSAGQTLPLTPPPRLG